MTTNELVIWESFIMRRKRDLDDWYRKSVMGDPFCGKFFDAIGPWLDKCQKAPRSKAPLCLTCEYAFRHPAQLPLTFLVTHSEDPRHEQTVLLTGVCWRCAEKSDTELLRHGSERTAKFLKGRVLGFPNPPPQADQ